MESSLANTVICQPGPEKLAKVSVEPAGLTTGAGGAKTARVVADSARALRGGSRLPEAPVAARSRALLLLDDHLLPGFVGIETRYLVACRAVPILSTCVHF